MIYIHTCECVCVRVFECVLLLYNMYISIYVFQYTYYIQHVIYLYIYTCICAQPYIYANKCNYIHSNA